MSMHEISAQAGQTLPKLTRSFFNIAKKPVLTYGSLLTLALFLGVTSIAHGQQILYVDCSGNNPSDYPSISTALANVTGPGATILVMGTCTENVGISDLTNLSLGAWYGHTANIVGLLSVSGSESVFLYGLKVTNPTGTGILIDGSRAVVLDKCSANDNLTLGLNAQSMSEVTIVGPASFNNNGSGGIQGNSGSIVSINNYYNAPTEISFNQGPGVWLTAGSLFNTLGTTHIWNNSSPTSTGTPPAAFGIVLLGAAKGQIGSCYGPNSIKYNQGGGLFLQENSEVSIWNCGVPNSTYVADNGAVGISAGFGSQVTLYKDAQITGHTGSGVELYGKSQLNVNGNNLISNNGTSGDPRSAGIVVDGNSEAYLRGGTIASNNGPAILALVNSSSDFTGVDFHDNSAGIITCDSSSYMVSNLSGATDKFSADLHCRTPHRLGNHRIESMPPAIPDSTALKLRHDQYQKQASGTPH